MSVIQDAIAGCLIGGAVADALGLPREGLSPRRSARLFPNFDRFHFLFGRGMFSDDAEHACMTGQSLLVSAGDPSKFLRSLSWRLRFWLLGLPLSIGRATLKSCLKLWFGWNPRSSGVWSAGNGPAMRAPILGACFGNDLERLRQLVRAATRITHRDPKAEWGAWAIARAASLAAKSRGASLSAESVIRDLDESLPPEAEELKSLLERVGTSIAAGQRSESFAEELGLKRGVSGYMLHTVPVSLHAWLSFPDDYRTSVQTIIRCGGDTDSTAAIVGALAGARLGVDAIPLEWRKGLCEWPRDLRWMSRLSAELAKILDDGQPRRAVPLSFLGIVARNLLFNGTVLFHVFRRMLPPYGPSTGPS